MYKKLPTELTGGKFQASTQKGEFVQNLTKNLLPSNHQSDDADMTYRAVHLDAKTGGGTHGSRAGKNYKLRGKHRKTVTVREKRAMKLFQPDPAELKYDLYLPLHSLWKDYINDLVNFNSLTKRNLPEAERRLLKADLHGAIVTVAKSRCPSLVGQTGILLQETKLTFKIITRDNTYKTIPKKHSVFSFCIRDYTFRILGNHLQFRASERASRAFKQRPFRDL